MVVLLSGTASVRSVIAATTAPHVLSVIALALPQPREVDAAKGVPAQPSTRRPPTRWVAVALFCYVGGETMLAGWSAVLPLHLLALSSANAAAGTSLFWLLLMLGRIAGGILISHGIRPTPLVASCQVGAGAPLAGSAATAHDAATVSVVLVGTSAALMGPCYALLLAQGLHGVEAAQAGRASATLIAIGALGGTAWTAAASGVSGLGPAVLAGMTSLAMVISFCAARRHLDGLRSAATRSV